ncbi:MAG: hypothetical protein WAW54_10855 [Parvibaculum sedimenti]|uniref:hypothetical protein n=1 Tax=Parvibaculum sedimenti TaxID=2608632 RepID=UPI003BB5DB6B
MIAMLLLTVFGLGAFCVLLFRCAVYALPVMVGLSTGYWTIMSGTGMVGGVLVGLVVGGLLFGLGQAALATSRSSLFRFLVVGVFAAPAALVGYGMMLEIWQLTMSPSVWQHAFGAVAGLVVAVATVVRLLDENPLPTSEKNVAISVRN